MSLPLLALKQATPTGLSGYPNPWLAGYRRRVREECSGDPELLRERNRRIVALRLQLQEARRKAQAVDRLRAEKESLDNEIESLRREGVVDLVRQNGLQERIATLEAELTELRNRPVPAAPAEDATGPTAVPATAAELRDLERSALEVLTTKLMEDLRKERGELTEEEKLAAVTEQQTRMKDFAETLNDPAKLNALSPEGRQVLYAQRDLSMALLSDEELARLYRALIEVYTGVPPAEWAEDTRLALAQTLGGDTSAFETKRFRKAAESLTILIGEWLSIKGPEKRKQQLEKEAEEMRIAQRQALEAKERQEVARKKAEEEKVLNRKVYAAWEGTWSRIDKGDFPETDEEMADMKKRFTKNQYLKLLVDPNPEQSPASMWANPALPKSMTEAELRGLIHHLSPYSGDKDSKERAIRAFVEVLRSRLRNTDDAFRLPKYMRERGGGGGGGGGAGAKEEAPAPKPTRPPNPFMAAGLLGALNARRKNDD